MVELAGGVARFPYRRRGAKLTLLGDWRFATIAAFGAAGVASAGLLLGDHGGY